MELEYKTIKGFENYVIWNNGYVQNIKTKKFLTGSRNSEGFLRVSLYNEGDKKNFYIHRLVAQAFITNLSLDKKDVHHINGDKTDNSITNLEWFCRKSNKNYGFKSWVRANAIPLVVIDSNGNQYAFNSVTAAAKKLEFNPMTIRKYLNNSSERSFKGYTFKKL